MNRHLFVAAWLLLVSVATVFGLPTVARAIDIEAFEFNDADGTLLANAANTVNAANVWVEDPGMAPSDIRGGVYNIVKGSLVLESNLSANRQHHKRHALSRRAHVEMGLREFRLHAAGRIPPGVSQRRHGQQRLDDHRANEHPAECGRQRRNCRRFAGNGFDQFARPGAAVATVQTSPFTAVLEINKTSNTYKVYYKDNTNPTQVLGMGAIAPTRNGNSVRMSVNNDFSAFNTNYPADPPFEVFAVDRIAVTDTNPFTDLITLEVDRRLRRDDVAKYVRRRPYRVGVVLDHVDGRCIRSDEVENSGRQLRQHRQRNRRQRAVGGDNVVENAACRSISKRRRRRPHQQSIGRAKRAGWKHLVEESVRRRAHDAQFCGRRDSHGKRQFHRQQRPQMDIRRFEFRQHD